MNQSDQERLFTVKALKAFLFFITYNGRVLTSSSPDIGVGLDYVLTGLDSVSHW